MTARYVALTVMIAACGKAAAPAQQPLARWATPTGWKSETIPFPLDFAPSLAHRGVEEIRFAPQLRRELDDLAVTARCGQPAD